MHVMQSADRARICEGSAKGKIIFFCEDLRREQQPVINPSTAEEGDLMFKYLLTVF